MEATSTDIPVGPLDAVRFENGSFVNDAARTEEEVAAHEETERAAISDRFMRLYSAEKLASHLGRVLGWVGRKKGLQSLQGRQDDPDFRAACEVVHRRLVARVGERALAALGDEAFEDVVVLSIGFGPVFNDVREEVAEKRKAARKQARDDRAESNAATANDEGAGDE